MQTAIPKRVFVTGAAGFVGSAVVDELLAQGFEATALLHRGQLKSNADRVRVVRGDLFSSDALDEATSGCDAAIHLVGIIREDPRHGVTFDRIHVQGTQCVVDAVKRAGIRRYVHMSALGARRDAFSEYHKTKYRAEEAVRAAELDATIFRPSLIHGPGGEFLKMEADWARGKRPPFFFMPYFGGGLLGLGKPTHIQPVFVKDVARAFVAALQRPQTIGQTYCVGGSQALTWPQMHHLASLAFTGKQKPALAIPSWYASLLTFVVPPKLLPFNRDQIIMAGEEGVCDLSPFIKDLGWQPGGFEETLKSYANPA